MATMTTIWEQRSGPKILLKKREIPVHEPNSALDELRLPTPSGALEEIEEMRWQLKPTSSGSNKPSFERNVAPSKFGKPSFECKVTDRRIFYHDKYGLKWDERDTDWFSNNPERFTQPDSEEAILELIRREDSCPSWLKHLSDHDESLLQLNDDTRDASTHALVDMSVLESTNSEGAARVEGTISSLNPLQQPSKSVGLLDVSVAKSRNPASHHSISREGQALSDSSAPESSPGHQSMKLPSTEKLDLYAGLDSPIASRIQPMTQEKEHLDHTAIEESIPQANEHPQTLKTDTRPSKTPIEASKESSHLNSGQVSRNRPPTSSPDDHLMPDSTHEILGDINVGSDLSPIAKQKYLAEAGSGSEVSAQSANVESQLGQNEHEDARAHSIEQTIDTQARASPGSLSAHSYKPSAANPPPEPHKVDTFGQINSLQQHVGIVDQSTTHCDSVSHRSAKVLEAINDQQAQQSSEPIVPVFCAPINPSHTILSDNDHVDALPTGDVAQVISVPWAVESETKTDSTGNSKPPLPSKAEESVFGLPIEDVASRVSSDTVLSESIHEPGKRFSLVNDSGATSDPCRGPQKRSESHQEHASPDQILAEYGGGQHNEPSEAYKLKRLLNRPLSARKTNGEEELNQGADTRPAQTVRPPSSSPLFVTQAKQLKLNTSNNTTSDAPLMSFSRVRHPRRSFVTPAKEALLATSSHKATDAINTGVIVASSNKLKCANESPPQDVHSSMEGISELTAGGDQHEVSASPANANLNDIPHGKGADSTPHNQPCNEGRESIQFSDESIPQPVQETQRPDKLEDYHQSATDARQSPTRNQGFGNEPLHGTAEAIADIQLSPRPEQDPDKEAARVADIDDCGHQSVVAPSLNGISIDPSLVSRDEKMINAAFAITSDQLIIPAEEALPNGRAASASPSNGNMLEVTKNLTELVGEPPLPTLIALDGGGSMAKGSQRQHELCPDSMSALSPDQFPPDRGDFATTQQPHHLSKSKSLVAHIEPDHMPETEDIGESRTISEPEEHSAPSVEVDRADYSQAHADVQNRHSVESTIPQDSQFLPNDMVTPKALEAKDNYNRVAFSHVNQGALSPENIADPPISVKPGLPRPYNPALAIPLPGLMYSPYEARVSLESVSPHGHRRLSATVLNNTPFSWNHRSQSPPINQFTTVMASPHHSQQPYADKLQVGPTRPPITQQASATRPHLLASIEKDAVATRNQRRSVSSSSSEDPLSMPSPAQHFAQQIRRGSGTMSPQVAPSLTGGGNLRTRKNTGHKTPREPLLKGRRESAGFRTAAGLPKLSRGSSSRNSELPLETGTVNTFDKSGQSSEEIWLLEEQKELLLPVSLSQNVNGLVGRKAPARPVSSLVESRSGPERLSKAIATSSDELNKSASGNENSTTQSPNTSNEQSGNNISLSRGSSRDSAASTRTRGGRSDRGSARRMSTTNQRRTQATQMTDSKLGIPALLLREGTTIEDEQDDTPNSEGLHADAANIPAPTPSIDSSSQLHTGIRSSKKHDRSSSASSPAVTRGRKRAKVSIEPVNVRIDAGYESSKEHDREERQGSQEGGSSSPFDAEADKSLDEIEVDIQYAEAGRSAIDLVMDRNIEPVLTRSRAKSLTSQHATSPAPDALGSTTSDADIANVDGDLGDEHAASTIETTRLRVTKKTTRSSRASRASTANLESDDRASTPGAPTGKKGSRRSQGPAQKRAGNRRRASGEAAGGQDKKKVRRSQRNSGVVIEGG